MLKIVCVLCYMIDPTVKYIMEQNTSLIGVYVYEALRKRQINTQKVAKKLKELYGEYYSGHQFIEFGEKYLDQYLIEKHQITFHDLLLEAFQPILHRMGHLH